MTSKKPLVPPPQPLNSSKDHYKLNGKPYDHLQIEIKLVSLKTIGTAILLGVPYLGLIIMIYSSGLKVLAAILIGTSLLIGGLIGLLYYLNREEPVKPHSNQNKLR